MLGGLGGEKTRWSEAAELLQQSVTNIVGDVLISGGCIAYLGFFPTEVCNYKLILLKYSNTMLHSLFYFI